jgi:hypothetical protein
MRRAWPTSLRGSPVTTMTRLAPSKVRVHAQFAIFCNSFFFSGRENFSLESIPFHVRKRKNIVFVGNSLY